MSEQKKLCIDLCAGLEGFSQAFKKDVAWEVVTVELNKKQRPTICADVRYLPLKEGLAPDVLLASPPCQRFSLMSNIWPKPGIRSALEIVGACLEAVPFLKPKAWAMENPAGRLSWFIGVPKQSIKYSDWDLNYKAQKPTHLWGNIALPMAAWERRPRTKNKAGKHQPNFYKEFSANPALSAKIPLGVSEAIKKGVESKL
jgi:hypothetical protein